jgi:hypothetical protein
VTKPVFRPERGRHIPMCRERRPGRQLAPCTYRLPPVPHPVLEIKGLSQTLFEWVKG